MTAQRRYGHIKSGRVATDAPRKSAWRRQRPWLRILRLFTLRLSDPAGTIFTASSPTSTRVRTVKFGDAPSYEAVNGRATTLRTYHVRTRRHRSALQGRLAPTMAVMAHSANCEQWSSAKAHHLRGTIS